MMKLFMFLCFVMMFLVTTGFTSNEPATGAGNLKVSSTEVFASERSSSKDNAAAIPEAATLMMIGYGLVGLAGVLRKMIKKHKDIGHILPDKDGGHKHQSTGDLRVPGVSAMGRRKRARRFAERDSERPAVLLTRGSRRKLRPPLLRGLKSDHMK